MPNHQASSTLNSAATRTRAPEITGDEEQGQCEQQQGQGHDPQHQHRHRQPLHLAQAQAPAVPAPGGERIQPYRGWLLHGVKGIGYLVLLLVYHALWFAVFLSLSIGISMLCSYLWDLISGSPLPPRTQSHITLLSLAVCGESHAIGHSQARFGGWISRKVVKHPIVLGMIFPAIFGALYLFALSQLYSQYMVVHPISPSLMPMAAAAVGTGQIMNNSDATGSAVEPDSTVSVEDMAVIKKMNWATSLFMLSISYMIYITARSSDWSCYRCTNYFFIIETLRLKCCVFLKYLLLQSLLLLAYSVPVVVIGIVCHMFDLPPDVTYVIIILSSAVIGIHAINMESKKPFPVVPQKLPNYEFEAHLIARSLITTYVLFPVILWTFYFSNNTSSTNLQHPHPDDPVLLLADPYEIMFLMYSIVVGLIVLQSFKIVLNVYYSKELILNWIPPPATPTPILDIPEPPTPPPEPESSGTLIMSSTSTSLNLFANLDEPAPGTVSVINFSANPSPEFNSSINQENNNKDTENREFLERNPPIIASNKKDEQDDDKLNMNVSSVEIVEEDLYS